MTNLLKQLLFIGVLASISCQALAELPSEPLSRLVTAKSMVAMPRQQLPAMDLTSLREKAFENTKGRPLQFADSTDINMPAKTQEGWSKTVYQSEAVDIWRYTFESSNAYSLNIGFSKFKMPEGGQLFIYADNYDNLIGPFTHEDNDDHGQLWTPVVNGKTIIIEVNIPTDKVDELELEVGTVSQAYLDIHKLEEEAILLKSGSCNVDVVCSQYAAGWSNQIRSVARYLRSGAFLCTGAAINNTANDRRSFFLTADHCGISSANAASVVAYWNYQNSFCRSPGSASSGSAGNGSLSQFNSGAIFRAEYAPSDMSLIEFDDPILPAANAYFSGWSRSSVAPSSAVAIHHPQGEEKRISFENNPVTITGYGVPSGGSTHLRVADWDLGTTEGGSSGSPLFNPSRLIVGQLHGGAAACGNNSPDWYGRLAVSWTGGGSNSTRLSNWLDPTGSGVSALSGANVSDPVPGDDGDNNDDSNDDNGNTASIIPPIIFLLLLDEAISL